MSDIESIAQEVAAEYRAKTESAIERMKAQIKQRVEDIIQEDMIDNYYGGYYPKYYNRTNQLPKSVGAIVKSSPVANGYSLTFDAETDPPYGPGAMQHIKRGRSAKKILPDEGLIFENFLEGIHPNVGPMGTTNVREATNKSLDDLMDEAVSIVEAELSAIT